VADGRAKVALATARRMGVTEAGFCIATEDRPRGGAVRCQLRGVGREGMGVAVTEQWDKNQEAGGREMGGGRTSEHLRRPTRVTAADASPNAKRRRGAEVTNRSVPRQDHITETERYFARGLESSAPTVSEGDRMPTVHNLSEVQRKCGVRGRTELHERESTMNRNKNPLEEGVDPRRRGGVVASLP